MFWFSKKDDDTILKAQQNESRNFLRQIHRTLSTVKLENWTVENSMPGQLGPPVARDAISTTLPNGVKAKVVRYIYEKDIEDGIRRKYSCMMDGLLMDSEVYRTTDLPPESSIGEMFEQIMARVVTAN